jgi:hypothetical protein
MAVLGAVAATSFNAGSTLSGYLAMLAQTQPGEVRGYAEVLTAVRGRIVAALWHQLTGAGRALATELSCQGELADPKAGARIAAELSPAAGGHPLAATLPLAFDPVGPPIDMAEVAQVLAMYGCGLDAWEYAVLATSRYFEPVRPAGGHR